MIAFLLKIVHFIGYLPLAFLYLLSSFSYLLFYKIIGYRKKVTRENLILSFPNKTSKEIKEIERKFYKNFFDILVETLYCSGISKKELEKRVILENPEMLKQVEQELQSAIFVTGHYNNWEWLARKFLVDTDGKCILAYKKITNKDLDNYMYKSRSKFGGIIIHIESFIRFVLKNRDKTFYTYLIADQTPHVDKIEFKTTFLNQETAVYLGAENLARSLKQPIYFLSMKRLKRGYYSYKIELVTKDYNAPKHVNTTKHLALLERDINNTPENWLWTHRRWKYTRKKNDNK